MRELSALLPDIAPPRGGLARLRQDLHAPASRPRPRVRRFIPATLALCALTGFAVFQASGVIRRHQATAALARTLQQTVTPPALVDGIFVVHGTAMPVPSADAGVRIYLVHIAPGHVAAPGKTGGNG